MKKTSKQKEVIEKPYEIDYRYRANEDNRDITSDNWITWGRTKGLTYGEKSPIEICESQVIYCLKGIQHNLEFPLSSPESVLRSIASQFNMLKNWQYILHCVRVVQEQEDNTFEGAIRR